MIASIDITEEQRKILVGLLHRYLPDVDVWAYGSRVKWTARPNSDLDLVAFAAPGLESQVAELKDALAESNLPFLVDLHIWDDVPKRFHEIIRKEYVELQSPGSKLEHGGTDPWEEVPLEDLADELTVGFVGPMATEYVSEGIPFLRSQNVEPLIINTRDIKYISPEFHQRIRKSELHPGDVVIVRTGKPGACAVIPDSLPLANCSDLVIVRCGKLLSPRFLAYFVNTAATHHISSNLVGAVQQHFNVGAARRILIPLPSLAEQDRIVHVLGALDDKIELNRKRSETLEAMARALFQSWFVDFDPVRAKAEGRDSGLPLEIAALFPDSFVDSAVGEIPSGWQVGQLDDLLTLQRGFDLPKATRTDGIYPVMAASGPSGTHQRFMVRGPGVTTGRSGVLGKTFFVHEDFWPLNTSLFVKEYRGITPAYAFHLLPSLDFLLFNAGSAVPTLNRNHVHTLPVVIPPLNLVEYFDKYAMPLLEMQKAIQDLSDTLSDLRDALLPKLISGELRLNVHTPDRDADAICSI